MAVEIGLSKNEFRDVIRSQEQSIRTLVKDSFKQGQFINFMIWVKWKARFEENFIGVRRLFRCNELCEKYLQILWLVKMSGC